MAAHWQTTRRNDAHFRPPLSGDEHASAPTELVRTAPLWEIPLTAGVDLGFSRAKGTIHPLPPPC